MNWLYYNLEINLKLHSDLEIMQSVLDSTLSNSTSNSLSSNLSSFANFIMVFSKPSANFLTKKLLQDRWCSQYCGKNHVFCFCNNFICMNDCVTQKLSENKCCNNDNLVFQDFLWNFLLLSKFIYILLSLKHQSAF